MNEWLLLYALGFFFACGLKMSLVISIVEGVFVSHNFKLLIVFILLDVVFWFVALPISMSKVLRSRAMHASRDAGIIADPIRPMMPGGKTREIASECASCGKVSMAQLSWNYACGHTVCAHVIEKED